MISQQNSDDTIEKVMFALYVVFVSGFLLSAGLGYPLSEVGDFIGGVGAVGGVLIAYRVALLWRSQRRYELSIDLIKRAVSEVNSSGHLITESLSVLDNHLRGMLLSVDGSEEQVREAAQKLVPEMRSLNRQLNELIVWIDVFFDDRVLNSELIDLMSVLSSFQPVVIYMQSFVCSDHLFETVRSEYRDFERKHFCFRSEAYQQIHDSGMKKFQELCSNQGVELDLTLFLQIQNLNLRTSLFCKKLGVVAKKML